MKEITYVIKDAQGIHARPAGLLVKKLKAGALDGRKWVYSYSTVMDITGQTNLSFLHTHYFMRGMFFFLILLLLNIKKRAA